jgi:hypothetical protein
MLLLAVWAFARLLATVFSRMLWALIAEPATSKIALMDIIHP